MQHFVADYGYLAVIILMTAESACIPVPSELVMPFSGAIAAGVVVGVRLNLVAAILAGTLGNLVGSYIAWAIGCYGTRSSIRRWGRLAWLREQHIARATDWFDRRGPVAVLLGRVIPVVRTFISLPAGMAAMAPARFGAYTLVGCLPWNAGLTIAGYELGRNWRSVQNTLQAVGDIVAVLIVLLAASAILVLIRRRHARAKSPVASAHAKKVNLDICLIPGRPISPWSVTAATTASLRTPQSPPCFPG